MLLFLMLLLKKKKKKDIFPLCTANKNKIYVRWSTPSPVHLTMNETEKEVRFGGSQSKGTKKKTQEKATTTTTQKSTEPFLNSLCFSSSFLIITPQLTTHKNNEGFEKQLCRRLARNTNNCRRRSEAASGRPLRLPRRRARLLFLPLLLREEEKRL